MRNFHSQLSHSSLSRVRISEELDLMKHSHPTNFKWRPLTLVKLSFRELCDSKLSGLCAFKNMAISLR